MTQAEEVLELQRRVRADQHVRSIPLIILGVLFVNYGATQFGIQPVRWQYAAPLAFVLIWAFFKLNENRAGVGVGRNDYLVAAGFVFTLTSLVMVRPFSEWIKSSARIDGIWVIIVGVALLGISAVGVENVLRVAGVVIALVGVYVFIEGPNDLNENLPEGGFFPIQPKFDAVVAVLGAALVAAGMVYYRRERARA